ncbi:MAG: PIN domain-containing protein [archaeon]
MVKLLLDTNFLMVPFQFGVDIYSEFDRILHEPYTMFTITAVEDELVRLSKTKPAAAAALKLAKLKKVRIIQNPADSPQGTDPKILAAAESEGAAVCTNDSALRRQARVKGLRVITLRQMSHLVEA